MINFCVQDKNKPCVRCTSNMQLISWIHLRGSETLRLHFSLGQVAVLKFFLCEICDFLISHMTYFKKKKFSHVFVFS